MRLSQKKNSQKRRLHLPPSIYLTYLLVCTLLMTDVSFSRYITTAEGQDSARVAGGGITVTGLDDIELTLEADGNGSATYLFDVSNVKNGVVSEVAMQYDVIVEFGEELPDGVTVLLDDDQSPSPSVSGNEYTFSDVGILEAGTMNSKAKHVLSFNADGSTTLSEANIKVTITVRAEQID